MRYLRKQKSKNIDKIKYNFFVFDTETTKLEPKPENFVFGVLYGFDFIKVIYSIEDFKTEFAKIKYKNKYIFAHNAEFDLTAIFGNIYKNLDNSAVFNGKFISAKLHKITFADSLNIFPASVKKIGETVEMFKLENDKVKTNKLTKENITQEDINYCIQDCKIVYTALLKIFEYAGTIKLTLSSLGLYNFRNKFLINEIPFSEIVDEFYQSYYGGRCEAFKIGSVNCDVYDINSLYPFVMRNMKFPDIKGLKKVEKLDVSYLHYLLQYFEGLAKVKIKHYEKYFGFVPLKTDKLLFPVGEFETTLNFNELRFAIKEKAIEILSVEYAVYSKPVNSPFESFIDEHYNLRLTANNELDKLIHKLIPNSLYGRFGMRQKFKNTYYDNIPFELIRELDKTEKFYELNIFSASRDDCFLVTENEHFKNSFFAIPTYSSYITSEARIYLLKHLLLNENNSVCYCDTDSIFVEKGFESEMGILLGQFKKEDKTVIEIKGLKNYVYLNEKGEQIETIKGINKNSKKIKEGVYESDKYLKTKESLRQNVEAGTAYKQIKTLKHKYDKRIILENGNTKPIKL